MSGDYPRMMRNNLSLRIVYGWIQVLRIYLSVGVHFLHWRILFLLHPKQSIGNVQDRMKQTLLIVRHGQTTWNVEHRLPGQLPGVALNEIGHQQAARLAEALKVLPINAVVSSPLERALDTAAYLVAERNLTVLQEPDLMDTNVGPWAGKTIDEVAKSDPAWKNYVRDPMVAPDGIETFGQVQQRVVAAVERWRSIENIGAYLVFVAHADVVKLLVAHYTGLDTARAGSIHIDNASVSMVEIDKEEHPHVVSIGWNPQPGWLKPPAPEPPIQETTLSEASKHQEATSSEASGQSEVAVEAGEQKL
jgi:broad specificity phosphatase PhoE